MSNPIHEWITEQEADRSMTLEQFYARIKGAVYVLRERLVLKSFGYTVVKEKSK